MARSMWTGVISFGLVTIPVKLHTATAAHGISFRQIHKECNTKIKEVRWCPSCDREIEWSEVAKGYEYAKNHFIQLTDEDLENLPLPSKNTIAVDEFVALEEIDPVYFDTSYFLEPDKGGAKPYALLLETLESKNVAGIATIALRTKERYCMIKPLGKTLMVQTLLYSDEIKVDFEAKLPEVKISAQEKKMAETLVDSLTEHFDPSKFKDHYTAAVKKMIDAKLEGEDLPKMADASNEENTVDLMEALRASIEKTKKGSAANHSESKSVKKNVDSKAEASAKRARAPRAVATPSKERKKRSKRSAA